MNRQIIRPRWFYHLLLLLPLSFCLYVVIMHSGVRIYIPELHLSVSCYAFSGLCLSITLLWSSCLTDLRNQCCQHWISAIGFHVLPITLLCLLVWAQYRFWFSLLLGQLVIGSLLMLPHFRPHHRRLIVTICAALLLIPTAEVLKCDMHGPTYELEQQIFAELQAEYEAASAVEETKLLEENKDLLLSLAPDRWQNWSIPERTALLQRFLAYQSQALGLHDIPKLTVEPLDADLLGQYHPDTNRIILNLALVASSSVQEVLYTSNHELFHGYSRYIIVQIEETIGWDSDLTSTIYFDTAREWRDNYRHYISPSDNFENYAVQPLEEAANHFAEQEAVRIQNIWEAETIPP